ncbi:MAG: hypothetical protein KKA28_19325 [Planctomycetes bacterium]|nr:hypothetical protein [Planctomycetota bacterium]
MDDKAKVIGVLPVDERVQDAARNILDDVVAVQAAVSGCMTPVVVRQALNNIQVQARSLLAGGKSEAATSGPIGQGYRVDMLEMLQGLADHLCCGLGNSEELSDEQLHTFAIAAEAAHGRINNYLLVRRAENAMLRREGGNGLVQPAA